MGSPVPYSEWGGQSMTFPLNPSPFLPSCAERPSVADASLRNVALLLQQYPGLSGIYVDSLASWGSYYNHRREHFAAARCRWPMTRSAGHAFPIGSRTLISFMRCIAGSATGWYSAMGFGRVVPFAPLPAISWASRRRWTICGSARTSISTGP